MRAWFRAALAALVLSLALLPAQEVAAQAFQTDPTAPKEPRGGPGYLPTGAAGWELIFERALTNASTGFIRRDNATPQATAGDFTQGLIDARSYSAIVVEFYSATGTTGAGLSNMSISWVQHTADGINMGDFVSEQTSPLVNHPTNVAGTQVCWLRLYVGVGVANFTSANAPLCRGAWHIGRHPGPYGAVSWGNSSPGNYSFASAAVRVWGFRG